jgi:2-keto-3-deoxy-L-rhamnonate aldolase RhmA
MRCLDGTLKQRIANGDFLFAGAVMDSRSGAVIEAYEEAGYDYILIDREHTALNSETILEHIRVSRLLGIPCMVRVADGTYAELCRTLDQWPDGIFVPRIRTRAQTEMIVETVTYPPKGKRGLGGSTSPAGKYIGWASTAEMVETINRDLVIGIQIETKEALENLDDILCVPGIDVALVGNDDLSIGMGIPGQLDTDTYRNAVKEVIAACNRHGVMPGIAGGDPAFVKYWADQGMRMFWAAADICILWAGAAQGLKAIRQALEPK